jgi:hypothetical protein
LSKNPSSVPTPSTSSLIRDKKTSFPRKLPLPGDLIEIYYFSLTDKQKIRQEFLFLSHQGIFKGQYVGKQEQRRKN